MKKQPSVSYQLDRDRAFVIHNYNWAKPFSNFFPGIAGKWGIPLWVYYVSRGQAVCSLGLRDKDHQILEFHSFNKAMMSVPKLGFRTFLRLANKQFYEPFQKTDDPNVTQQMRIHSHELELLESHKKLGLQFHVRYFPLAQEPFAAFIRQVEITNQNKNTVRFEVIDGHPRILPYGLDQHGIKTIPRHVEAMMGVKKILGVPLFRLKQSAEDSEQVKKVEGGNFYHGIFSSNGTMKKIIVDPEAVFGEDMNYDFPWLFASEGLSGVLKRKEMSENKTPCAFLSGAFRIPPGKSVKFSGILGNVARDGEIRRMKKIFSSPNSIKAKRLENQKVIRDIEETIFTVSSSKPFDAYCKQDFLDNVMRGGMPLCFKTAQGKSVFYVYSRQNGDIERDYHYFVLDPTYLSQGTGHYRSVHQNRRTDVWFFPETEDANLVTFMNLIQLDGYNPLEVKGLSYRVSDEKGIKRWLAGFIKNKDAEKKLLKLTKNDFTPGEFLMELEKVMPKAKKSFEDILGQLFSFCEENELGGMHEGFWVDHWTYNLDLIDTYLSIFPEKLEETLMEKKVYSFFDDPDVILPRDEKSVDAGGKIRRYGAVIRSKEKIKKIAERKKDAYKVRTKHGKADIYQTTLFVKLLSIVVNRMATLDPEGIGVEMEADKPGWNDSMNGLPGLFGSSLNESLELLRALRFLRESLEKIDFNVSKKISVYEELSDFLFDLSKALKKDAKPSTRPFIYWDESNGAKEAYRKKTFFGISGKEKSLEKKELNEFLDLSIRKLEGIPKGKNRKKSISPQGVPYTYFTHAVTKHRKLNKKSHQGYPLVKALEFRQEKVALFLEGPVHYMKVHPKEAKRVYEAVRKSPLFDKKLKMYKACQNMEGQNPELGRAVGAYPRGWIENESIYLHMEYKYLLEVIRSGLYDEFYRDIQHAFMPFMDPKIYGRSILEGASFIVSSAYADPKHHGQAFQPRLSGITCEFLHIWTIMVAGAHPFGTNREGKLELKFSPKLADWLFTKKKTEFSYLDPQKGSSVISIPKNSFAFKFLNRCLVVYHNPLRKNSYGKTGVEAKKHCLYFRNGSRKEIQNDFLDAQTAKQVRDGEVFRIDVELR